jgi:hypothetical protein
MGVSCQLNALPAVAPEQEPPVPTEQKAAWALELNPEALEKGLTLLPLLGIEPHFIRHPAHSPVTILIILSWLNIKLYTIIILPLFVWI